jgi:hypothetical protein
MTAYADLVHRNANSIRITMHGEINRSR